MVQRVGQLERTGMERSTPLPIVRLDGSWIKFIDLIAQLQERIRSVMGIDDKVNTQFGARKIENLIEIMVGCTPAAEGIRQVRQNSTHVRGGKPDIAAAGAGQIHLNILPANRPFPQVTRNFLHLLFLRRQWLQDRQEGRTQFLTPLSMELCHPGPILWMVDADPC